MSAIHAAMTCGLSQVSVTARMSIVLEIIKSVRDTFSRMERMLVVAMRMLCLTTGPGLRLTYHASSKVKANLNVGLELNIGSNFRLKQRLRHGRLCKYVKESCVVMYLEGIEIASKPCASVLRLLEVTEQDNNKTHKENTGDI